MEAKHLQELTIDHPCVFFLSKYTNPELQYKMIENALFNKILHVFSKMYRNPPQFIYNIANCMV